MKATFIEMPGFERHREDYLDDDGFRELQESLMANPAAGDVIAGTGGLRKLQFRDASRGKGKRGGLRVIYYFWNGGPEFWLYTLYDKDELTDLPARQRFALWKRLISELRSRT